MPWILAIGLILGVAIFFPEISARFPKWLLRAVGNLKRWYAPRKDSVKFALRVLVALILVGQAVGFALFMIQEALQTVMFSVWQAPRGAPRESLARTYRHILDAGWATLYSLGWLNPLAWGPYRLYFLSAEEFYHNAFRIR